MLDQLSLQERAPIISAISVRTVERLPVHFVLLEKVALLHRECNNRWESAKFITAVEGHYRAFDLGGHAGVLASLSMSLPPPQGMPRGARLGRGAIRVRVSASSALILRSPPGQFPLD